MTNLKQDILMGVGLVCLILTTAPSVLLSQQSDYEEIRRAVVRITTPHDEVGSGFLFCIGNQERAYIMTARHLIENYTAEDTLKINFIFTEIDYPAKIGWAYREVDLAILRLENYPATVKALRLGDSKNVRVGDEVYALGFPGGRTLTFDDGRVSSLAGNKIYLDDITPVAGNSGSPLLSREADNVIGMILQDATDPRDQYARKINSLITHIEDIEILKASGCISKHVAPSSVEQGSFGIAIGPASHNDPIVYLDTESSGYIEAFVSLSLPQKIRLPAGFRLAAGLSGGFDKASGKFFSINRDIVALNGFFNLKAIFAAWHPLIINFGGGIGAVGIIYEFSQGDSIEIDSIQYISQSDITENYIRFAANIFAETEFHLSSRFHLVGLVRWTPALFMKEVKELRDLSFDPSVTGVGELSSVYLGIGIKYVWH